MELPARLMPIIGAVLDPYVAGQQQPALQGGVGQVGHRLGHQRGDHEPPAEVGQVVAGAAELVGLAGDDPDRHPGQGEAEHEAADPPDPIPAAGGGWDDGRVWRGAHQGTDHRAPATVKWQCESRSRSGACGCGSLRVVEHDSADRGWPSRVA